MIDHPEDWWSERRTIDHPLLSRPDDWWDYSPRYRINYVSATGDDDTDSTSDDDQGAGQLHNGHAGHMSYHVPLPGTRLTLSLIGEQMGD